MQNDGPKLTFLGKLFMALFIGGCLYLAWHLFMKDGKSPDSSTTGTTESHESSTPTPKGKQVEIGIAYGTEKERWLKWAAEEFSGSKAGQKIRVNLIPMGSLEGARAVVAGDERIHVWSPASRAYENVFLSEWTLKHNTEPIAKQETLALTPMVFVFWKERYDGFLQKYPEVSFSTISEALQVPDGWQGIASHPEWGFFKFGHTNPNESNSGLIALTLMAQHYHEKIQPLQMADIMDAGFQQWLKGVETSVSGLINSTGTMMKDMVLKGPSAYDCIMVYENTAIDYLKNAEGRWGTLQVVYPEKNMWNDNPYYVLDTPWSSREQRAAAETFLEFLMSPEVQQQSLVHGFRPGDPSVSIREADSPFVAYEKYGLSIDIPSVCEPPTAEAIQNLLTGWQRIRSR